MIIVEGLLPNGQDHFASELNASLAQALDAEVVLVSTADIQNPRKTAARKLKLTYGSLVVQPLTEQRAYSLCVHAGYLKRQLKYLSHLTRRYVQPKTSQNLRQNCKKYNRYFGSSDLPIIGLVPFSNTLSVPRTLDIASVIDGQWINQGEAKTRRILHSSLIASSIEYELNKFIAGELIISASERTDVLLASSLATSNGIPLAGLVLTERGSSCSQALEILPKCN